ncbi:MAG: restriction endonuclease [Verrucomicrobiota bacterium]|nr:restriction endonuclease [Verrucomicrobiota bacterium]
MNTITDFVVGEQYTNDQIRYSLNLENMGGIRPSVGSVEINSFRGALNVSAKGVFVTTSHFTRAAMDEAHHEMKPSITLIDGQKLSSIVKKAGLDPTPFLP